MLSVFFSPSVYVLIVILFILHLIRLKHKKAKHLPRKDFNFNATFVIPRALQQQAQELLLRRLLEEPERLARPNGC